MRRCEIPAYFRYYRPRAGDVIMDAGSYKGYLIDFVRARFGDSITILAVEPDPENFRFLSERHSLSGNVKLVNKALWRRPETLPIYSYHPTGGIGSSVAIKYNGKPEGYVEADSLSSVAADNGIGRIDFIKMDIEGAEPEAIEGAVELLRGHLPHLAIASYHRRDGRNLAAEITGLLSGFDYEIRAEHVLLAKMIFAIPRP